MMSLYISAPDEEVQVCSSIWNASTSMVATLLSYRVRFNYLILLCILLNVLLTNHRIEILKHYKLK